MRARYAVPILIALLITPAIALADSATVQVYTEQATLQVVVYDSAVSYAANSSIDINVSVPSWLSGYVDAVVVHIYNASGQTQLSAYDVNKTKLATADVVPLSSGYSVTLPANTAKITLSGSQAWSGTIKIVVESAIEFQVTPPTQITITNGQGEANAHIKQVSGPPGQIYLVELDPNFDISFRDETPEYQGDTFVETTGAGWEADVPIVVTTSASPGTYNVEVYMYFKAEDVGALEVGKLSFTFDLSSNSGTGSGSSNSSNGTTTSNSIVDEIKSDPTRLLLVGVGILLLFALVIMAFSGGGKRRGMARLTGEMYIIIMMMFVAVIGVAITMLSKEMALALGVGVAAFMILLLFMSAGKIKVSGGG